MGQFDQTGSSHRYFHNIVVNKRKLNNMKSEKILSVASWGIKIAGAESQYSSAVLCNIGSWTQAYSSFAANSQPAFSLIWPTPYVKNVPSVFPMVQAGNNGDLPIEADTKAKLKVGLTYANYEIEISNNLNTVAKCELYIFLAKNSVVYNIPDGIKTVDQDYGLGAPIVQNAAAGLAQPHTYGYPTDTTLGTYPMDWPQIKKNWKLLKVLKFNLPPTTNQTHIFKIVYNKLFDESADRGELDHMKGRTIQFYWRAKGEVIRDDTISAPAAVIGTAPTDISFQITARKYFQAANDPMNPPLKFAAQALPTGAANDKIQLITQGEAAAILDSLFAP